MTHGSIFSGIGGFDLAAEWMGWENVFHCEINLFCQQVLKKNFPKSLNYNDIKKTDFSIHRGQIDVLSGGFPCQPYSVAGNRKGKEDDRHLWPEMLRAIKEIQPRWVIGENVPGLINWSKGMVFHEVQTDLETAGFEVFPPLILPACSVNASHRRDRIWFIAYSNKGKHIRTSGRNEKEGKGEGLQEWNEMELINESDSLWNDADPDRIRQQRRQQRREQRMQETQKQRYDKKGGFAKKLRYSGFRNGLSAPRVFRGDDGVPNGVDRVKSIGNAIVPQVVFEIFKTIEQYEQLVND